VGLGGGEGRNCLAEGRRYLNYTQVGTQSGVKLFVPVEQTRVSIIEELLKYNLSCLVITTGTLTKNDLSFIVDSLESTSAA
jgi:hypothetical protein